MNTRKALTSVGLCLGIVNTGTVAAESICFGTSSNGRLEGGIQIPEMGTNYRPYSSLGVTLGRTYLHSKVGQAIVDAYKNLEKTAPGLKFVYGESGWQQGGRMRPHRTHRNGTAVDFMVPVMDDAGRSVPLPTGPLNKYGYSLEFDQNGVVDGVKIDFEALSTHLYELSKAAAHLGIPISRVIFEKAYIPRLYKTSHGDYMRKHIPFMAGEPWIRHDEHYHIDFAVQCKANER